MKYMPVSIRPVWRRWQRELRYVAKRKLAPVLVIRLRVLSDAPIARVEQSAWEDALETIDLLSVRGASGASRQLVRRLSGAEGGVCRTGSRIRYAGCTTDAPFRPQ
jgi:hypothetical protein